MNNNKAKITRILGEAFLFRQIVQITQLIPLILERRHGSPNDDVDTAVAAAEGEDEEDAEGEEDEEDEEDDNEDEEDEDDDDNNVDDVDFWCNIRSSLIQAQNHLSLISTSLH